MGGWIIGLLLGILLGWLVFTLWKQTWPRWTAEGRMQLWKAAFTLVYLTSWILVTLVAIYYVWGVQPPDISPNPKELPTCPEGANLEVKDLDPSTILVSTSVRSLRILGCGFTADDTVAINGETRTRATFIGPSQFIVPLEDRDKNIVENLAVTVTKPKKPAVGPTPEVPAQNSSQILRVMACCSLPWGGPCVPLTAELRLLLLVLLAGTLGSTVYALKSFADYVGDKKLTESWFAFYVIQPLEGAAVGFIYYVVVRGGFLSGDLKEKTVNDFGVSAIGALVGLYSDQALKKLGETLTGLFSPKDDRADKIGSPEITTNDLPPLQPGIAYNASLKPEGGTPPYKWTVDSLPDGLSLTEGGSITGTPRGSIGPKSRKFTVTDASGRQTSKQFNL